MSKSRNLLILFLVATVAVAPVMGAAARPLLPHNDLPQPFGNAPVADPVVPLAPRQAPSATVLPFGDDHGDDTQADDDDGLDDDTDDDASDDTDDDASGDTDDDASDDTDDEASDDTDDDASDDADDTNETEDGSDDPVDDPADDVNDTDAAATSSAIFAAAPAPLHWDANHSANGTFHGAEWNFSNWTLNVAAGNLTWKNITCSWEAFTWVKGDHILELLNLTCDFWGLFTITLQGGVLTVSWSNGSWNHTFGDAPPPPSMYESAWGEALEQVSAKTGTAAPTATTFTPTISISF